MLDSNIEAQDQPGRNQEWVSRTVGLDVMRALAMVFVIILHLPRFSGDIMENEEAHYRQDAVDTRLWGYMGIPMLGILTGYLSVGRPVKSFKLLRFDMQVRFYVVLDLLFQKAEWNMKTWAKVLFPVLGSKFWYGQRFMVLQFMRPILDHGIEALSTAALCVASGGVFAFLCLGPYLTESGECWSTEENLSYFFLVGLYIIGAAVKRVATKWRPLPAMACSACVLVINYWLFRMASGYGAESTVVNHYSFVSLVGATAMLVFFSRIQAEVKKVLNTILDRAAQNVLSVYMIHMFPGFNTLVWKYYKMTDYVLDETLVKMLVGFCFLVFAECWFVDWVRQFFFMVLEPRVVKRFCATKIDPIINQLSTRHKKEMLP